MAIPLMIIVASALYFGTLGDLGITQRNVEVVGNAVADGCEAVFLLSDKNPKADLYPALGQFFNDPLPEPSVYLNADVSQCVVLTLRPCSTV